MPDERDMHDMIDKYVDGSLPDEDRAEFEAAMEQSSSLRAMVELQRRIDSRLAAIFDESEAHITIGTPADFAASALAVCRLENFLSFGLSSFARTFQLPWRIATRCSSMAL